MDIEDIIESKHSNSIIQICYDSSIFSDLSEHVTLYLHIID